MVSQLYRHEGQLESDHEHQYLKRARALLYPILKAAPDIICVQEYWFHSSKFQREFERELFPRGYVFESCPRPRQDKEDGLAMFIREHTFEVLDIQRQVVDQKGERVLLLVHVRLRANPEHVRVSIICEWVLTMSISMYSKRTGIYPNPRECIQKQSHHQTSIRNS